MPSDEDRYAPSVFMSDLDIQDNLGDVNESLPRGTEGGIVETVKRAIVTAVREALSNTGMTIVSAVTPGSADEQGAANTVYVDVEYPMKRLHYPGVWVQFSSTSLRRAGIDQEAWVQRDDEWCPVQEWEVQGRVTLTVVALDNKSRDRLADTIISLLAFSRPPNIVLTDPAKDAKQFRALKMALADNPHISMTLNTDVLYPGGQQTNIGTPFAQDMLAYEDSYAFDLLGQFNILHRYDGVLTLERIDVVSEQLDSVDGEYHATSPWYGAQTWRTV